MAVAAGADQHQDGDQEQEHPCVAPFDREVAGPERLGQAEGCRAQGCARRREIAANGRDEENFQAVDHSRAEAEIAIIERREHAGECGAEAAAKHRKAKDPADIGSAHGRRARIVGNGPPLPAKARVGERERTDEEDKDKQWWMRRLP